MIAVSLLDFVRSGAFGPVTLGQSREQLRELLGPPDAWGPTEKDPRRALIWKYGTTEFHFPGPALSLIHSDAFEVPEGGAQVDLDPWILIFGLALPSVEAALADEGITYSRHEDPHNPGAVLLRTEAGVAFLFAELDEGNPPGLSGFSLLVEPPASRRDPGPSKQEEP